MIAEIALWRRALHVTGGYVELGLHTRASAGSSASFAHLDNVELIKL